MILGRVGLDHLAVDGDHFLVGRERAGIVAGAALEVADLLEVERDVLLPRDGLVGLGQFAADVERLPRSA